MMKKIVSLLCGAVLFLISCSSATNPNADPGGIQITQMDSSIGGVDGNANEQVVSYQITLHNGEAINVVVHWLEPVLAEQLMERLTNPENRVLVEKTIAPNSSLEINGEFTFDTKGATKTQITSWEPLFTGFTISTEMQLPVPGQGAK